MFSTLRTRFGVPGIISVIALVFAMFGGAYAASNSSNAGKATASAKAKKGPRGPKGATGPAGPAGAQGPAGPAGAKGDAGANGSNGAAGPTGPTGAAGAKGTTGVAGPTGPEGSPWTAGGTLPSGKTETGTWNVFESAGEFVSPETEASISFPIPLAAGGEGFVFNAQETKNGEFGASGCAGTVAKPTAPKGKLCVYTIEEELANVSGSLEAKNAEGPGFGTSGAFLLGHLFLGEPEVPARADAHGTWAVTAP